MDGHDILHVPDALFRTAAASCTMSTCVPIPRVHWPHTCILGPDVCRKQAHAAPISELAYEPVDRCELDVATGPFRGNGRPQPEQTSQSGGDKFPQADFADSPMGAMMSSHCIRPHSTIRQPTSSVQAGSTVRVHLSRRQPAVVPCRLFRDWATSVLLRRPPEDVPFCGAENTCRDLLRIIVQPMMTAGLSRGQGVDVLPGRFPPCNESARRWSPSSRRRLADAAYTGPTFHSGSWTGTAGRSRRLHWKYGDKAGLALFLSFPLSSLTSVLLQFIAPRRFRGLAGANSAFSARLGLVPLQFGTVRRAMLRSAVALDDSMSKQTRTQL